MSKFFKLVVGAAALALTSGCATIMQGYYQEISVESNVPLAYCTVEQEGIGLVDAVVVPGRMLVPRDRFAALHVTCSRVGYTEKTEIVPPILPGDQYPELTFAGMGSTLATAGISPFFDANSGAGTWYPDSVFVWLERK
jgi:hypothetical protein